MSGVEDLAIGVLKTRKAGEALCQDSKGVPLSFTRECLERVVNLWKVTSKVWVGTYQGQEFKDAAFIVRDLNFIADRIQADISFLPTPRGKALFEAYQREQFRLSLIGYMGFPQKDHMQIEAFDLIGFEALPEEAEHAAA